MPMIEYSSEFSPKGTPVRAIAVFEQEGLKKISETVSETYFVGVEHNFSLPVIAITVPEKELFNYEDGIFIAGKPYEDWARAQSEPMEIKCGIHSNFRYGRRERGKITAHATFYDQGKGKTLNTAIKGHGSCSSWMKSKSIRLYLDQGSDGVSIFDQPFDNKIRINLRNSGNSFFNDYLRDAVAQNIISGLAVGTQRYSPKIVFLNGEYWGILNARDRKDHYYLADRYEVEPNKVDLLKKRMEVDRGSKENYEDFLSVLKKAKPKKSDFFESIDSYVDISSFNDFFISSLYFARRDWPRNNVAYWRYHGESPAGSPLNPKDGRWRWLAYDIDSSFEHQQTNMLDYASNSRWHSKVFNGL